MTKDLDDVLSNWPYEPGEISVRQIVARNGRTVLQMRLDLGAIQMEVEDRPDGRRPHGHRTYLDYLRHLAGAEAGPAAAPRLLVLTEEQLEEVDREFLQFYHRRITWLVLKEYSRAIADADHTLAFMDFVRSHCPNEDFTRSHEQFRGFVLFHRSQARAALAIEQNQPEEAIDAIQEGILQIHSLTEPSADGSTDEQLTHQLEQIGSELRNRYDIGQTLRERLAEAVANEDYEQAAQLRDRLARRRHVI